MERSQLFELMSKLQLYGMKAAFDEIMATAVKRQHEPQRIIGDLLTAEINEKQARSIKYQLSIAKLPLAKDLDGFQFKGTPINEPSCAISLAAHSSPSSATPCWWAELAPVKPILRSPLLATVFDPAPVAGSTTWWISSIALRAKPAMPGRAGLPIS